MIFQDPRAASIRCITSAGSSARRWRCIAASSGARSTAEARRLLDLRRHPRRGSGGSTPIRMNFRAAMNQRVMIAMALAGQPDLLVADEPTTALDATIQAQILDLLGRASAARCGMAMVLISHDLGVVAENCDRVARDVCRPHRRGGAGRHELFDDAAPSLHAGPAGGAAAARRAAPPSDRHSRHRAGPANAAAGLRLRAALRRAQCAACELKPPPIAQDRAVRLHPRAAASRRAHDRHRCSNVADLLVDGYDVRAAAHALGLFGRDAVHAVDGVSLDAPARPTRSGLVGESGCGKSTTGRSSCSGWSRPTRGEVRFDGEPMPAAGTPAWRALRRAHADGLPGPAGRARPAAAGRPRRSRSRWTSTASARRPNGARSALAMLRRGRAGAGISRPLSRTSCPAASASASCWRARWPPSRISWSATSRSRRSTSRSRRRW